jgi:hypothetical protein
MHEFDRNVLRVGGRTAAPKYEEASAALETFCHLKAARGEARTVGIEKTLRGGDARLKLGGDEVAQGWI